VFGSLTWISTGFDYSNVVIVDVGDDGVFLFFLFLLCVGICLSWMHLSILSFSVVKLCFVEVPHFIILFCFLFDNFVLSVLFCRQSTHFLLSPALVHSCVDPFFLPILLIRASVACSPVKHIALFSPSLSPSVVALDIAV